MSELPISSPYRSSPDAPVTEAERDRVSARLNAAFEAGAIDADAYSARLDALFAATRLGQLVPVVEGLPAAPTHQTPAIVSAGTSSAPPPGQLAPARGPGRSVVVAAAVVGGALVLILLLLLVVAF